MAEIFFLEGKKVGQGKASPVAVPCNITSIETSLLSRMTPIDRIPISSEFMGE